MKLNFTPTVHTNGTSRDDLVEQAAAVCTAARALMDAISNATPNGRDYYPQGDGALWSAMEQVKVHVVAVKTLEIEWMELACRIQDAGVTPR